MADGTTDVVYILNGENRFALFPGVGLLSSGGAYDGSVERYFDIDSSLVASLSGDQTISGQKIFLNNPIIGEALPVLTSGEQTISGLKTFVERPFVNGVAVVLSGDAAGVATPNDLTFGFGIESSGDVFNGSVSKTISINPNQIVSITGSEEIIGQKTFTLIPKVGSGSFLLTTGDQTIDGSLTIVNNFIQSGVVDIGGSGSGNYFGQAAYSNFFGNNSISINQFGSSGVLNKFGSNSIYNSFGESSSNTEFGKSSVNKFGESGINTFYSGLFTGQAIFENNIIVGSGRPVMNTGVELIDGIKTFLNDLTISGDLILGSNNDIIYSEIDTIIGGSGNILSGDGASIIGGHENGLFGNFSFIAVGDGCQLTGDYSVIAGGLSNKLNGNYNFIGAGQNNKINNTGYSCAILNGDANEIKNSIKSSIIGGNQNYIEGDNSFIGCGFNNKISGINGLIIGGFDNKIEYSSGNCSIIAGRENYISGEFSLIGAGENNEVYGNSSILLAGKLNKIYGSGNLLLGGYGNNIIESGSDIDLTSNAFIGGGFQNTLYGKTSVLVGGSNNLCSGLNSFIGGGENNEIKSINSIVVGGQQNKTFNNYALIVGGLGNIASGEYSTVLAGSDNQSLSNYSTTIGRRAIVDQSHIGSMVIADGQERDHYSKGAHTLSLDFFNGVYFKLPQFTGLSSQPGNRGEMAVSGDCLYVCTGVAGSGWGRIQLSSF